METVDRILKKNLFWLFGKFYRAAGLSHASGLRSACAMLMERRVGSLSVPMFARQVDKNGSLKKFSNLITFVFCFQDSAATDTFASENEVKNE